MSPRSAARALDRALDRLLAGEPEAEPDGNSGQLAAARRLRTLPRPAAEAPARSLARDLFLAEADARRARWVHSHHVPAVAPPPPRRGIRLSQLTVLLAALLIAIFVGGVVAVGASFSTPDSSLYGVKRAGEGALIGLARDPVARSDLEVKLAEERLREAETMAANGKPDLALDTLADRYSELRDAGDRLSSAPTHDARWRAARTRFLDEASKPVAPLQRQLTQKGYPTWAAQASDMATQFQRYLDQLTPSLGVQRRSPDAAPQPSPPAPAPSPSS